MVPRDEAFRTTFQFMTESGPEQYTFFSNSSASYNEDVDASLAVWGYQVSHPDDWEGGKVFGEGSEANWATVVRGVDGSTPLPDECQAFDAVPDAVVCNFIINGVALAIYAITAETGVLALTAASPETATRYLSGTFDEVRPEDASEFFTTRF